MMRLQIVVERCPSCGATHVFEGGALRDIVVHRRIKWVREERRLDDRIKVYYQCPETEANVEEWV